MLARYDFDQPLLIGYLARRAALTGTFNRCGLVDTGYEPGYLTVQPVERNRIRFYGSMPRRLSVGTAPLAARSNAGRDWRRMPVVEAWMSSVIAVSGTLLGSLAGYVFQRLNAGRTERFARDERLRQERIATYSGYAGAVTDLRRAVVSLWFLLQRTDSADPELLAAHTEADRFGAAAAASRSRVQLLADEPALVQLAAVAAAPIESIRDAADLSKVKEHEARCDEGLRAFIVAAGAQLR